MFALGPDGDIRDAVSRPFRHLLASVGVTHQRGGSTMSIRPSYEEETDASRGVGGTTLGSAGTTYFHREIDLTYNQQTVISPTLVNQFQILVGHELEPMTSVSSAARPRRRRRVHGRRRAGRSAAHRAARPALGEPRADAGTPPAAGGIPGARLEPARLRRQERLRRDVLLRRPRLVRRGPAVRVRAAERQRPRRLAREGAGRSTRTTTGRSVRTRRCRSGCGTTGRTTSTITTPSRRGSRSPIKPGGTESTVIRGGAGVFYDKIGPFPIVDVLNFRPGGLQRIVITESFVSRSVSVGRRRGRAAEHRAVRAGHPGAVDAAVQRRRGASAAEDGDAVGHVLRVRRRAGCDRAISTRRRRRSTPRGPIPRSASSARSTRRRGSGATRCRSRSAAGRAVVQRAGAVHRWPGRSNDSGGVNWYPANDYDLSGEWARADFDRRHRLLLFGSLTPAPRLTLGRRADARERAPVQRNARRRSVQQRAGERATRRRRAQQPAGRGQRRSRPARSRGTSRSARRRRRGRSPSGSTRSTC